MSITQLDNTPRCEHIRLSGQRCKAPARRGTHWCLFHAAEHNEAPLPFSSSIDDAAGIHAAVGQVLFDLQRDCIDFRRAALLFSGLRIARTNLKQLGLELGETAPEPRQRPTKQDEEDARLAAMPSLAEILLERLNQLTEEPDDVADQAAAEEPVADAGAPPTA